MTLLCLSLGGAQPVRFRLSQCYYPLSFYTFSGPVDEEKRLLVLGRGPCLASLRCSKALWLDKWGCNCICNRASCLSVCVCVITHRLISHCLQASSEWDGASGKNRTNPPLQYYTDTHTPSEDCTHSEITHTLQSQHTHTDWSQHTDTLQTGH